MIIPRLVTETLLGVLFGAAFGVMIGCVDLTDEPLAGAMAEWSCLLSLNCGAAALLGGAVSRMIQRKSKVPLAPTIGSVVGSLFGIFVYSPGGLILVLNGPPVDFHYSPVRAAVGTAVGLLCGVTWSLVRRSLD